MMHGEERQALNTEMQETNSDAHGQKILYIWLGRYNDNDNDTLRGVRPTTARGLALEA